MAAFYHVALWSVCEKRQMLLSALDLELNEIIPSGSSLITLIECLGCNVTVYFGLSFFFFYKGNDEIIFLSIPA